MHRDDRGDPAPTHLRLEPRGAAADRDGRAGGGLQAVAEVCSRIAAARSAAEAVAAAEPDHTPPIWQPGVDRLFPSSIGSRPVRTRPRNGGGFEAVRAVLRAEADVRDALGRVPDGGGGSSPNTRACGRTAISGRGCAAGDGRRSRPPRRLGSCWPCGPTIRVRTGGSTRGTDRPVGDRRAGSGSGEGAAPVRRRRQGGRTVGAAALPAAGADVVPAHIEPVMKLIANERFR